jgi:hypothetical protein
MQAGRQFGSATRRVLLAPWSSRPGDQRRRLETLIVPRPSLVLVGACAGVLLLAGCGDGRPTASAGGTKLATSMTHTKDQLEQGVQPLVAWRTGATAGKDVSTGCDKDEARRTYSATLDVPDSQRPDAATHALEVVGQLLTVGWDAKVAQRSSSSATLTATRTTKDGTGSKLQLVLTPVKGGWHYALDARTACLPTSG